MNSTFLAAAVYREIEREGITLTALSERTGRSQSAMSQLLARGLRASPETMGAISRHWTQPGAGARIMIAHLQDELQRAQWPVSEYSIEHRDGTGHAVLSEIDRNLADLRAAVEYVPALASLLADILTVARTELPAGILPYTNHKRLKAADPGHEYKTKGKSNE
jgi:hypothetical protein